MQGEGGKDQVTKSDPKIIQSVIGPDEIQLYESQLYEKQEQHGNWVACILSRKAPIAPVKLGHRAYSTCLIHDMAMVLKWRLHLVR